MTEKDFRKLIDWKKLAKVQRVQLENEEDIPELMKYIMSCYSDEFLLRMLRRSLIQGHTLITEYLDEEAKNRQLDYNLENLIFDLNP